MTVVAAAAREATEASATPPAPEGGVIDLSMNEGPPPPGACFDVLQRVGPGILRKYADARPLEAAYARYLGVESANVLATTGADDAIDRVFRAFMAPGQELVFPTPTFEMVPAFARMAHGALHPVPYEWGTLPHDDLLARVTDRTAVVAVLTPDNPTGRAFTTREVVRLAAALPAHVVLMVDSAYAEFAEEDHTEALRAYPSAIAIRTMSKSWGLAGLRVGFAVGAPDRIDALRKVGGPYALAGPSIAIAQDRLAGGVAEMRGFVSYVRRQRERLADVIRGAGGRPEPSQTNFVLAEFADGRWVQLGLRAQGVLVRRFPHLPDHVRITVPRDEGEFAAVTRAFSALVRPDALLFDMDGVLADVRRSYREAIRQTAAAFGVRATHAEIEAVKAAGGSNDDWEATQRLLAEAGVDASLDEVTARFEALYQGGAGAPGLRRHETLIPPRGLLQALAASHKVGIVTGRPRADAERFLRDHGLEGLFGAVVCREDAPLKPRPEPVALAMRRLGARTAWMLGDNPDDVRAAAAAGAIPVGVVPPGGGETLRDALEDAGAARVVEATKMASVLAEIERVHYE